MADALVLSPEAPYPLAGGGQMRTASLLHYLALRGNVDLITFREPGSPHPGDALPRGLIRELTVIDLPAHSKTPAARAWRNLGRAIRRVPPLVDRFRGFDLPRTDRRYSFGLIEHLWCAPYEPALRACCAKVLLDLHNVESRLLATSAAASLWPASILLGSFAHASARYETEWIPRFDTTLVCSDANRQQTDSRAVVYPNAIPLKPQPRVAREPVVAFSGNLGYMPNQAAVTWFASEIWPRVRQRRPGMRWRLIGRNETWARKELRSVPGVEFTGPVEDALPHLATAAVTVVPLLSGSGTRIKILEAWASGTPVVSTPLGAEGLDATDGVEVLLSEQPANFADQVIQVLESPALAAKLSVAGRILYEKRYTWDAASKLLDASGALSQ